MNVIFLDFDGPMIPARSWVLNTERSLLETFDPIASATVKKVLDGAAAKLVITSTWRYHGKERCVDILERSGISRRYLHKDWSTPILNKLRPGDRRRAAIKIWLAAHSDIENYAVIDDEYMDIDNLVHVSFEDGILFDHQKRLLDIFGIKMR